MPKKVKKVSSGHESGKNEYYGIAGILVLIGIVVVALVLGVSFFHSKSAITAYSLTPVYGEFFKVSSQDFAPPGETDIYYVSWIGCPLGAANSWPLYMLLSHYGTLNVSSHLSIYESDIGFQVPGLIFYNFTPNSKVHFYFYYLTGQYLNETVDGKPIKGNILDFELQELKNETPSWFYNITYYYTNVYPLIKEPNGSKIPVNYAGVPPHIIDVIVITGPGGTYMLIGEPYGISLLDFKNFTPQELLQDIKSGNVPAFIQQVYNEFYKVLQIAMS